MAADARAVYGYLAKIEGIPTIFVSRIPTGWSAGTGRSYKAGLQKPGGHSQSVSPSSPIGSESLPQLEIRDDDSGNDGERTMAAILAATVSGSSSTWLLGGDDATGTAPTSLAANDTVAAVQSTGVLPSAPAEVYIGLECVSYSALGTNSAGWPAMTGLSRGLYPAVGDPLGRLQRCTASSQNAAANPRVATQAAEHVGRLVAVYEILADPDGNPDAQGNESLLFTGFFNEWGVTGNTYTISLTSVIQFLQGSGVGVGARGMIHAAPWAAVVKPGTLAGVDSMAFWAVNPSSIAGSPTANQIGFQPNSDPFAGGGAGIIAAGVDMAAAVGSTGYYFDAITDTGGTYPAPGGSGTPNTGYSYTTGASPTVVQFFVAQLGVKQQTAVGGGAKGFSTSIDVNTGIVKITVADGAGIIEPQILFGKYSLLGRVLGFTQATDPGPTAIAMTLDGSGMWTVSAPRPAMRTAIGILNWAGWDTQRFAPMTIALTSPSGLLSSQNDAGGPQPSGPTELGPVWLAVDGTTIVRAVVDVSSPAAPVITPNAGVDPQIYGDPPDNVNFRFVSRDWTDSKPLAVRQVWIPSGSSWQGVTDTIGVWPDVVELCLRLLLSTGCPGYNDPNYDVNAAAWGVGLPAGVVDVGSFEALRDVSAAALARRIIQPKPLNVIALLEEELKVVGAYLVMRAGRLTVIRNALPASPGYAVVQSDLGPTVLDGSNTGTTERPTASRGFSMVINAATLKVDYNPLTDKFGTPLNLSLPVSQGETGVVQSIEIQSRGIRSSGGNYGGVALGTLSRTIANTWARYSRGAMLITRGINRTLSTLTPGDEVLLSSVSLPNPWTGERGINYAPAVVTSVSRSWKSDTGWSATLYLYPQGAGSPANVT